MIKLIGRALWIIGFIICLCLTALALGLAFAVGCFIDFILKIMRFLKRLKT